MTDRFERAALLALAAFSGLAVAGFAVFGRHPSLLAGSAIAQRVYGAAFVWFARGQVLLAAFVLLAVLARRTRFAWLGALGAVYAVSLASELAGTTVGLPFGAYRYTDALGLKWFGHVPLLIPLSWFVMAAPSFALAGPMAASRTGRVLVGSLILLAWDLALDPAMSYATKYWVWGTSGPYYGMPWLNLFGWYVTGLALMGVLTVLRAESWISRVPFAWMAGFYLANLALAVGLCAAAGLVGAVLATLAPIALVLAGLRADRRLSTARA